MVLDVVEELVDEEKEELADEVGKLVFVLDLVTRLALVVAEEKDEPERLDGLAVGVKEVEDGVGREELIKGREVTAEE